MAVGTKSTVPKTMWVHEGQLLSGALGPSALPGISSEWSECHFAGHGAGGVLKEDVLAKWI